ncbi:MAG: hypothetical protein QG609_591, partial [Patescibacteria group bacterium]|nr:hypothetical protein [Patescibacteria group bacterium]
LTKINEEQKSGLMEAIEDPNLVSYEPNRFFLNGLRSLSYKLNRAGLFTLRDKVVQLSEKAIFDQIVGILSTFLENQNLDEFYSSLAHSPAHFASSLTGHENALDKKIPNINNFQKEVFRLVAKNYEYREEYEYAATNYYWAEESGKVKECQEKQKEKTLETQHLQDEERKEYYKKQSERYEKRRNDVQYAVEEFLDKTKDEPVIKIDAPKELEEIKKGVKNILD